MGASRCSSGGGIGSAAGRAGLTLARGSYVSGGYVKSNVAFVDIRSGVQIGIRVAVIIGDDIARGCVALHERKGPFKRRGRFLPLTAATSSTLRSMGVGRGTVINITRWVHD